MKVFLITAGAAGMYCGSCFRDNALAAELMARGHDVLLLPLYTPTRTDERNVSHQEVFFGGINVYLQQKYPIFRRFPRVFDRFLASPWLLNLASGRKVSNSPRMLGELTVSMLKGEQGFQQKELANFVDWLKDQSTPDVINLPNSLLIGLAKPLKDALRRPVVCTLQGEDLFLNSLQEPFRSEALRLIREAVGEVDLFIAVSGYYTKFMSEFLQIPLCKIRTVPLGINLQGMESKPFIPPEVFRIGYFARVAPEKGLHLLCEAYRRLREANGEVAARLEVAGYLGPEHRDYLGKIRTRMRDWGLGEEFHYRGVLNRDEKLKFLKGVDVLSVPATYDEPKGLFLLEAMAVGTPVVQPRRGAFTEIIESTGGGLLVEADDPQALAAGLRSLVRDPSLVHELGRRGAQGVRREYPVARMADQTLEVYRELQG